MPGDGCLKGLPLMADVRNRVLPATIGDDQPRPGTSMTHLTFFVFDHVSGSFASSAKLPDTWSKTKNVKWVIDVPGRGWSSPIVAGNTLFLTSAISGKPFKQPSPGIYGNDYIA